MGTLMSACPNCGRQIDQTSLLCQHCGHLPAVGWSEGLQTVVLRPAKIGRLTGSLRS